MTQARWHQLTEIFHGAVACAAGAEREAYLDEKCGPDAALRTEVEALLAAHDEAGSFGARPLAAARSAEDHLSSGTRLGPHEIVRLVGAGGMGEVYEARDTRLDRVVAVKVLTSEFGSDPERRARFVREAKTIAKLNHPHICTLYDVGRDADTDYLVMELLEGKTLAGRLNEGPLPIDEALRYGAEIADALATAHKAGIVHRDLKPGNIMLTKAGAKLLDFGLAKLKPPVGTGESTTQHEVTAEGAILGTLQYMAPEQLEGRDTDARADIFALGAVLYEMLTGKRAFEGDSQASLIGAILHTEPPPVSSLQPLVPVSLDRLVRTCLEKDPDARWQSAADLGRELKWIRDELSQAHAYASDATAAGARARRPGPFLAWLAAGAALTASALWVFGQNPVGTHQVVKFNLAIDPAEGLMSLNGIDTQEGAGRPSRTNLAFSPDGTRLAFAAVANGQQMLFVKDLDGDVAVPLEGTEGGEQPVFSPDGSWVMFWSNGWLRKAPVDGSGVVQDIVEKSRGAGASWSEADLIVYHEDQPSAFWAFRSVGAGGGPSRTIAQGNDEAWQAACRLPQWLPGGQAILCTIPLASNGDPWRGRQQVVWRSLESGESKVLLENASDGRWVPTGHLVFMRDGSLMAVPFDLDRLESIGDEVRVVDDVMHALSPPRRVLHSGGAGQYAFSSKGGHLAYMTGGTYLDDDRQLARIDRSGKVEFLPWRGAFEWPRLSPDGSRILVNRRASDGLYRIVLYDLERGSEEFPYDGPAGPALWSDDGESFVVNSGGRLVRIRADGLGEVTPLDVSEEDISGADWGPDQELLVLDWRGPSLYVLFPDGRKQDLLSWSPDDFLEAPSFSPDGRWLLYHFYTKSSNSHKVYVQPYPSMDGRITVSAGEGTTPAWSRGGREIIYREKIIDSDEARFIAVAFDPDAPRPVGEAQVLFRKKVTEFPWWGRRYQMFEVTADGQRLLALYQHGNPTPAPPTHINIVLNWFEELREKAPVR